MHGGATSIACSHKSVVIMGKGAIISVSALTLEEKLPFPFPFPAELIELAGVNDRLRRDVSN